MHDVNLFRLFTDPLNELKIQYFVTGSVAAIVYGEPRLTHDIDVVIHIVDSDIDAFIGVFGQEQYYCPPKEVILAEMQRSKQGMFNLIHHETGFKADIFLAGKEDLQWWAMHHIQTFELSGGFIRVAPPEYVILKKLEYFKEGGSQKHLLDINSIIENTNDSIDFDFLSKTMFELGLDGVGKHLIDRS